MKLHKHFPPHLAQLVFLNKDGEIKKINSIDYDLFIWLIYNTHKKYKDDKTLVYEFEYKDIKKSFKKSMNVDKIKESLNKIGEIQILSNYLQSYGDKEIILTKPFEIEIIHAVDSNISYGFSVETTDKFMQWFNNPKPKVDVNYNIIYNLKPTMSKLLYLFLRDAYGAYKETKRYRNVDIYKLRHMMNVSNELTTNSNFITQFKKAIDTINEDSNITVEYEVIKKRNLRSGATEVLSVKFSIELDEMKLLKKRVDKSKNTTDMTDDVAETKVDEFEKYIKDKVSVIVNNRSDIKNIDSYSKKTTQNLLKDESVKMEYEFYKLLENEKLKVKSSLTNTQPYMIVLKDSEKLQEIYYLNNSYQFIKMITNETITDNITQSIEFYDEKMADCYYWDIFKCDYTDKYKVSRI